MTLRKRRIILMVCGLFFLLLAPIVLLRSYGYSIDKNLKISKTGGLYISSPLSGSEIFIKNKKEKETNVLQSGLFSGNLGAGIYRVSVIKDGYWPWFKSLEIKEGFVTEARAFLIPREPSGKTILRGGVLLLQSSPYEKILLLVEKNKNNTKKIVFYLPSDDVFFTNDSLETASWLSFNKDISDILWQKNGITFKTEEGFIRAVFNLNNQTVKASRELDQNFSQSSQYERRLISGKERLWWNPDNNEVWMEWLGDETSTPYYLCDKKPCESTKYLITTFQYPIKNIDFFPQRKDVIIIAINNGVFAVEIDGRGGNLMQPIYKGANPSFAIFNKEKVIYILDNGALLAVNLE